MSTRTQNDAVGKTTQGMAVMTAVAPMALLAAWMHGIRQTAPDLSEFFLGPLLIGGAMIFWLLFLHLVVCRDRLPSLGLGPGRWVADLAVGVAFGAGLLVLKHVSDPWLAGLFPRRPPTPEIVQLIRVVAADPWLLALWLGPVVWLGVAAFEELWRVFVLHRLWLLFPGRAGAWSVVLMVSVLIGFAHGYQGPAGGVSIAVKSVLMGAYFMKARRLVPLIVAHAVYDSVQIAMAAWALRGH
jgi:hypothetical protein